MAHGGRQFLLVGYSEYLERRPLKFVDPIPPALICSACGNVAKLTFSLLCGHVLCKPCYQSCATTSECVCPLDGDLSARDDVTSKMYPAENLLRRKVHCWNEANGCRVVLPASQVAQHAIHDCHHHVICCPTCSAVVLSRDQCAHLKSGCATLVLHATTEAQPGTDNSEKAHFVAFEREVKRQVCEMDAKLAQLSLDIASLGEKLVDLCHHNNVFKETLLAEIGAASGRTIDRLEADIKSLVAHEKTTEQRVGALDAKLAQLTLESASQKNELLVLSRNTDQLKEALIQQFRQASDRHLAEMKTLYSEKCDSLTATITSLSTSVPSDQSTHQRVMTGYAALKEKALKKGSSYSMSDAVYLKRYLISWGIDFKRNGDSVNIIFSIQLHEGREDNFLDWPFTKELRLIIIHPETRQELHINGKASSGEANKRFYGRPKESSNKAVCFYRCSVASTKIETEGYVKSDQLLLRFEVL